MSDETVPVWLVPYIEALRNRLYACRTKVYAENVETAARALVDAAERATAGGDERVAETQEAREDDSQCQRTYAPNAHAGITSTTSPTGDQASSTANPSTEPGNAPNANVSGATDRVAEAAHRRDEEVTCYSGEPLPPTTPREELADAWEEGVDYMSGRCADAHGGISATWQRADNPYRDPPAPAATPPTTALTDEEIELLGMFADQFKLDGPVHRNLAKQVERMIAARIAPLTEGEA